MKLVMLFVLLDSCVLSSWIQIFFRMRINLMLQYICQEEKLSRLKQDIGLVLMWEKQMFDGCDDELWFYLETWKLAIQLE